MKEEDLYERYTWWEKSENKEDFKLPISVIQSSDNYWVATCNKETEKYLGESLNVVAQGKTKEDAINQMFMLIRFTHDHFVRESMNFERWVPFRKGDWSHTGGSWFSIFGFHFYFRKGDGMKGGKYIPGTKLNISFTNYWRRYNRFKKKSSWTTN